MINILLNGCNGKMGQHITQCARFREDLTIVAGLDIRPNENAPYPVYTNAANIKEKFDLIVDFSHPSALNTILGLALERKTPIVIATTGLTDEHKAMIEKASKEIPVLLSANMSLGINLLIQLVKKAAQILYGSFDIEIIEKHHNQKVDAPSGTALAIADAINAAIAPNHLKYVYDRHSSNQKRTRDEIGLHAIRGGTIVGEHSVIFAGNDEIIEIKHTALSKNLLAEGALKSAVFLYGKEPGLYRMQDIFNF
ncbi:4-hydroxy-tetrahydrodipicolinate reductase [Thermoclostridium caenicola]|uniref:4-hydroxy-tetrahydrodipicolinate reductase n=1 Tax=Thermoclostridium caenicola TaxID=659425 RepID=A0A1M6H5R5_9FIRM|nr:4-hydroxy-tetrahydrodipicolinate reductase [Thermoclostridium caenicola]SHJ17513.1 dihydrodipicolinate reductase [Thermoclostridium caenicola]HOP71844.1 4-hydroxy-tetrahydrodipicolinate reductase [Thermoclostridium caenicola]HPU21506.1 4-hydroxy-tetrahydrodipicolinate reductase [Thermoclostridium caenicola]